MAVLITVGSTSFDNLIKTVCSEECMNLLIASGFKEIIFQIGNGSFIPEENPSIKTSWFRFKNSISEDIKKTSLVIGHGGAGTILETLSENKPLIVVLNEELMDNHQGELAEKLAAEDFLKYTSCSSLVSTLQAYIDSNFSRITYDPPKEDFGAILHYLLGLK